MTLWRALRQLLPLLAAVSLALAPTTVPAFAGTLAVSAGSVADQSALADAAADMADMPCCPSDESTLPDCHKNCPLAALCLAKVASRLPAATALPLRLAATPSQLVWRSDAMFTSLALRPPPEPPRS